MAKWPTFRKCYENTICWEIIIIRIWTTYICNHRKNPDVIFKFIVATLTLGLQPRQKGLQRCGLKGSLRVTSKTPRSEGECEGVSHHTPKATPTLGDGVPVDSRNFRERFEGSNLNGSWRSLYHLKALEA
jgi:hypothetical protein